MKSLYDPVSIGRIDLQNRLIRSATFEFSADATGHFDKEHARIYEALAKGGVGAIITGMVGVGENAQMSAQMVDARDARFVPELRQVVDTVHACGGRLIVQLSHCGIHARIIKDGKPPLGPSAVETASGKAREMTLEQIQGVIDDFAESALFCKEAGADGVQLHAAHGYLLSQFLSPYFNKRSDRYGGDIADRSRIVMEIYDATRKRVGTDFPIWIKINSSDLTDPGLSLEECYGICQELAKRGIDAIEISGGLAVSPEASPVQKIVGEEMEGFFAAAALFIADRVDVPVISVCGHRSLGKINEWLNKGNISAISMSRPLISEPNLVNRWQNGDESRARCISCNQCFRPKGAFGCQNPAVIAIRRA